MILRVSALTVAVLCLFVHDAGTYPSGAPEATCGDMVPRHGSFVPQTDPSPFSVSPSAFEVASGNRTRLMLSSRPGVSYAGFMLQAHSPLFPGEVMGTFTNLPDLAKAINCGNNFQNTATQKNRMLKKSLEFEWEAPAEYEGPIVFNATFVQDGATFWVGVESDPVQIVKRSIDDRGRPGGISTTRSPIRMSTIADYTPQAEGKASKGSDPIYEGCNTVKSCFGFPDNCVSTKSCTLLSTILVKGDRYEFELMGVPNDNKRPKYVALGLSDDTFMADDSVMECVADGGNKVDVFMSYNIPDGKNNQRLNELNDKLNLLSSRYDNGKLYCKFSRDTVTTVKGKRYDLANDEYYLLLAAGTSLKDNGARVGWHDIARLSTGSPRQLAEVGAVSGSSDLLYRLHGAFMIAAWIGCASIGILMARYFKLTWVGRKIMGKDLWFVWHRIFMVLTWILTCSGFVIIFVQIQDWYSETSNPHAVLGCITTGLAFIQPFGAALRPSPDSPKRPIFNWLHWLVGNFAHILAIVTIFFSVKLSKAELPEWTDWILVSYVTFHVFMHLIFSIVSCFSERQWEKRVNDFPMKEMATSRSPLHSMDRKRDAPHSCFRKFLLTIYLIVIIAIVAALIAIVVLAPIEEHWAFKEAKKIIMKD
ncbi:UNVERIFIED_CONTAM: hypothetical protein PYX00_000821 [Menopon gallinae]|uniref:Ferric-chelate reductase 1 n=1 Tax=Menopon gallinae TaxID=328185 RepID=A0AAW2IBD9_9NEOP